MASDLNAKMWQLFLNDLIGQVSGADASTFLPTSGLDLANWQVMNTTGLPPGNPAAKSGEIIVPNLEAWADTMPSWSPNYVPGDTLYNNYFAFLNSIQLRGGDPAQQQIADGYAALLTTAQTQLSTDRQSVFTGWAAFNAGQAAIPVPSQMTFNDWYNSTWAAKISSDIANIAAADTNYLQALQAVGGPDFATISAARTKATLNVSNGILDPATQTLMPNYTIIGGLNDWFLTALQSVTLGKGPEVDFTIDCSQAESHDYTQSSYLNTSTSGGYGFWFWGGGGSSSSSQSASASDYSDLAQSLKMRYTAQAITPFTVTPGGWYDAAIIKGFYDQISPNSALANKPLFGAGGLLNLRTAQIYVAFKRSITLTGSAQTMAQLKSTFQQQSHTSFSIGGFFWSGSASVDQGSQNARADMAWSSDGNSVTITDNTNAPKVIGIVPQNLDPRVQPHAASMVHQPARHHERHERHERV